MNLGRSLSLLVVAALLATSCTIDAGDGVIGRRLTWFNYVSGVEFRRVCATSPVERYRVVFNGEFTVQVRTYDIAADAEGALVYGRVFRGSIMSDRAFPSAIEGLLGREGQIRLSQEGFAEFRRSLDQSGPYHGAAPVYLRSDSYFWVVLSCVDGAFRARAFTGPRDVLEALPFRDVLLANDPTGVPMRVQRTVEADSATGYGRAYSPMLAENPDRARGGVTNVLFQFLFEDGRFQQVGT